MRYTISKFPPYYHHHSINLVINIQRPPHSGIHAPKDPTSYWNDTVVFPSCMTSFPLFVPLLDSTDSSIHFSSSRLTYFPLMAPLPLLSAAFWDFLENSLKMSRRNGSEAAMMVTAVSEADQISRSAEEKVKSTDRAVPVMKYVFTMAVMPALVGGMEC
jgi:hypothetical protein